MNTALDVLLILLFVAVLAAIRAPVIAGIRWAGRRVDERVNWARRPAHRVCMPG
jgi:hypothetical protein